jgi:thiol-disulfide isomerase/thioredoxin|tara:strand:- start:297 stop:677 length:381 start_codon:yes stop_codon:yes gene_type:complete
MNWFYGLGYLLGICLWLSPLHSQAINLNNFQAIQLMSLEDCAVVQVNASWNFANRLEIEKLKDCYVAEIDLANKNIGAVIQKEWNIKTVPTIIIFEKGKEVMRFEAGISMKFDENEILRKIRLEIK